MDHVKARSDAHAVTRSLAYLNKHGCPFAQPGEGSNLFKPRQGLKTPDIVAGVFRGEVDPRTFFIDVVAPTGDQVTNELAGAPDASRFLLNQITTRSGQEWTLADIPAGLGKPLAASVLRKAVKYANARAGSPLFGVIAYFNEHGPGKQLLTMMAYLKAIHDELGQLSERLAANLLVNREHDVVLQSVRWDQPLAFLLQLVDDGARPRGALVVNEHARISAFRDHEVMTWLQDMDRRAGAAQRT